MNDINYRAVIGGNNPPSIIELTLQPFQPIMDEVENWLDGTPVENEEQMKAVDSLIKSMKEAKKAVDDERDKAVEPLHKAWKDEIARWKTVQDDVGLQINGLLSIVDKFKRDLDEKKKEEARTAWVAAESARREALAMREIAAKSDIAAQREAIAATEYAEAMMEAANDKATDKVKGLRRVVKFEVIDKSALFSYIAKNHRHDIDEFIAQWAAKNHRANRSADGLRVWEEREAF